MMVAAIMDFWKWLYNFP